ncbi:MAG: threonine/homoserine/homoserine lactone efflux protein [Francisella sp.]|jgi:threonine/homoserine/homoserine lactone efflux protein
MENNKSQEIEGFVPSEEENKPKKPCIYRKALSYLLLVTILVLFCVLEIVVLVAIFSIFSIFYVVLFSVGILYLIYLGLKKISQYYSNKKVS